MAKSGSLQSLTKRWTPSIDFFVPKMVQLRKYSVEDLPRLKDKYKANWPLHIATFSTIDIFARRFLEHPEWRERVTFYGVQGEPENFSTVIMIHSGDKVFFDTLEPLPHDKLRRALFVIELGHKISFINIRDCFRPLLLDIIRTRKFDIRLEVGFTFVLYRIKMARQLIEYDYGCKKVYI